MARATPGNSTGRTAEQKANRIIAEEFARRGWQESELATRRRSDPGKLAIAARLRSETTLPIKWIAALWQIGPAKGDHTKGINRPTFELGAPRRRH